MALRCEYTDDCYPTLIHKFAVKNYPVCDIFLAQLEVYREREEISPEHYAVALKQLTLGKSRMATVLSLS